MRPLALDGSNSSPPVVVSITITMVLVCRDASTFHIHRLTTLSVNLCVLTSPLS